MLSTWLLPTACIPNLVHTHCQDGRTQTFFLKRSFLGILWFRVRQPLPVWYREGPSLTLTPVNWRRALACIHGIFWSRKRELDVHTIFYNWKGIVLYWLHFFINNKRSLILITKSIIPSYKVTSFSFTQVQDFYLAGGHELLHIQVVGGEGKCHLIVVWWEGLQIIYR